MAIEVAVPKHAAATENNLSFCGASAHLFSCISRKLTPMFLEFVFESLGKQESEQRQPMLSDVIACLGM